MKKTLLPTCIILASCFTTANAAVVLQYDSLTVASGGSATELSIVGITDTALVASAATNSTLGSNATFASLHANQTAVQGALGDQTDLQYRFGSSPNGVGTLNGTIANSLAIGAYIEFSFTAATAISLDELSFDLFNNSFNGSAYAARDVGLFVDVAGGGFNQFGALDETATRNGNQGTVTFINLDPSFNASNGDQVTYRLAFSDRTNTGNGDGAATRIGNVQISATAIPEPGSVALLGLGGLALVLRRRK